MGKTPKVFNKSKIPNDTFLPEGLETIRPLDSSEYYGLLKVIPVDKWEKATNFLYSRHLVILPREEHLQPEVVVSRRVRENTIDWAAFEEYKDSFETEPLDEGGMGYALDDVDKLFANFKNFVKVKDTTEELVVEAEAEADRIARVAAAHKKRMQEQQAAALKRQKAKEEACLKKTAELLKKSEAKAIKVEQAKQERIAALAKKTNAVLGVDTDLAGFKHATEVIKNTKVKIQALAKPEGVPESVLEVIKAATQPLVGSRSPVRPIRVFDLAKLGIEESLIPLVQPWVREFSLLLLKADNRLKEVLHEGWSTVVKSKGRLSKVAI